VIDRRSFEHGKNLCAVSVKKDTQHIPCLPHLLTKHFSTRPQLSVCRQCQLNQWHKEGDNLRPQLSETVNRVEKNDFLSAVKHFRAIYAAP
jgi:hypothetical protein